jgi:gas vesicle protein
MKRFLVGFVIGAGCSAAIVLATTPRSGAENRQRLTNSYSYARQRITEKVQNAMEEGRNAASSREQELWADFHQRLDAHKQKDT